MEPQENMPWHSTAGEGTIVIAVYAQPKAHKTEIVGLHNGMLKIRVAAPALEDKANQELVRFLAAEFKVGRRDVVLLSGDHSRHKRFAVSGSMVAPESLMDDDQPRPASTST
jgi:uncharacterized protein (TIGR00251 family)